MEGFVRGAATVPFYYILARENSKLVGLAGLYVFTESMVYLDSWNPLVLPGDDFEEIFIQLVRESIEYTRTLGRTRLEVFLMNLTDDIRGTYERLRPLYEAGEYSGGMSGARWCVT